MSVTIVHTGAGFRGTLILTNIQVGLRSSQSSLFFSQADVVELTPSRSNPGVWYAPVEIDVTDNSIEFVTSLKVRATVENSFGFRTTAETLSSLGMSLCPHMHSRLH